MTRTQNFADVIRAKIAADPALAEAIERADFNAEVAEEVFAARESAGLTQGQLAEQIGSHQSAIARLESSSYGRQSLATLYRIAKAVGKKLHVGFYSPPKIDTGADSEARRQVAASDAAKFLSAAMRQAQLSRSELANRIGKPLAFVSQVLDGDPNVSLAALSDVFAGLGYCLRVACTSIDVHIGGTAEFTQNAAWPNYRDAWGANDMFICIRGQAPAAHNAYASGAINVRQLAHCAV